MKPNLLVVLVLLLAFLPASAQTTRPEAEKIATFCKVWGFLKYYHPAVAKGELDGDREFTTGIGVYYPDGRETQRVGIVPDVEVHPTVAGFRAGRDEVLEKAVEIAGQK